MKLYSWQQSKLPRHRYLKKLQVQLESSYGHNDVDFIDFNIQTTLPHKLSEYSPALAAGDIDGNGFDDLLLGGNSFVHAHFFTTAKRKIFTEGSVGNKDRT